MFFVVLSITRQQVTESADEAIVQQLLDASASVDVTTAASDRKAPSRSPLWIAARAHNSTLVKQLLSANANPNILSGENRTTPLLEVCYAGDVELARVLLEAQQESDVNCAGVNGESPLCAAASAGSVELIQMLIDRGGDVNHRAVNGVTALYTCCSRGHFEAAKVIQAAGADVSVGMASDGASPLFVACAKGYVEIVEWLLSVNANPNQVR